VAEHAVVNSSPLIFLTRGGLLDLLQLVAPEIIVPSAVANEILRRGSSDPAARAIATVSWLRVLKTPEVPPSIQAWDLGPGESAVLSWCVARPGTEAIVDDLGARRCAQAIHIPVRGTLGLVLLGKQRGRLTSARPVLEALRGIGMYLSDSVMNRALQMVGE
jgi:predicted nucleic acid-binding protein